MRFATSAFAFALVICTFRFALAENNSGWLSSRGPLGSGSLEGGGEYPVKFGDDEYAWRAELPGKACSTPIVVGEAIYVTAPVEGKDALLCFDTQGAEKWRAVFGPEDPGKHRNGSGSNASPVTDGEGVYVYFKSGVLAAIEANGKVRWQTNLVERYGKDTLFWDHGTSPVLTQKHVVMARMHKGDSWLAAFDKATGELAWKFDRNYTTPMENDHGYTTPLVIEHDGQGVAACVGRRAPHHPRRRRWPDALDLRQLQPRRESVVAGDRFAGDRGRHGNHRLWPQRSRHSATLRHSS